ncbi:DNA-processing protein DprA [Vagococcus elongatus]|nr:DNA-processing protein DprA [Vagococcus elongatus]
MTNLTLQAFLLKHLKGIGNIGLLKIFQKLYDVDFFSLTSAELAYIGNVRRQHMVSFEKSHKEILEHIDQLYEVFHQEGFISIADESYPKLLLETYNPPLGLFFKGDISLLKTHCVAIVGARDFSSYGIEATQKIVAGLVDDKYTIVSGLAKGIDTFAHKSAIQYYGKTIAIIGSGLDIFYPKENRELQNFLGKNHLVLSEFLHGTPPRNYHFPMRNRIIAGISQGTCVIEAKKRSGSLITAQLALENGREVFAVPGNIFSKNSTGCHELIEQGAKCVWNGKHIIEEIEHFKEKTMEVDKMKS